MPEKQSVVVSILTTTPRLRMPSRISRSLDLNSIFKYEASLKSNKFLLLSHGSVEEVEQAREILETTKSTETIVHHG